MSTAPIEVVVITASTREGRFGPTVARWFTERAQRHPGVSVVTLDLAATTVPGPELAAAVDQADAVVIVTPEYNHSFPGPLKTAIDSVRDEWAATPVGFVSYGGVSGGLRAVESLRPVFAELHAVTVRETVSFPLYWDLFDEAGELRSSAGADAAAVALLDQLAWWADALRTAKARTPYGSAA